MSQGAIILGTLLCPRKTGTGKGWECDMERKKTSKQANKNRETKSVGKKPVLPALVHEGETDRGR